jgi:hypothetical protein
MFYLVHTSAPSVLFRYDYDLWYKWYKSCTAFDSTTSIIPCTVHDQSRRAVGPVRPRTSTDNECNLFTDECRMIVEYNKSMMLIVVLGFDCGDAWYTIYTIHENRVRLVYRNYPTLQYCVLTLSTSISSCERVWMTRLKHYLQWCDMLVHFECTITFWHAILLRVASSIAISKMMHAIAHVRNERDVQSNLRVPLDHCSRQVRTQLNSITCRSQMQCTTRS